MNQHGVYERIVRNMAENALNTRDRNAFGIYRGAFTTSLTADGQPLCSDTHVTIGGQIVDNKLTAKLSEPALNDAFVALQKQVSQSGVIKGHMPYILLVPTELYKTATEITGSELRSGTADNDLNVYSSKYGVMLLQSPYISDTTAGGSTTSWFVLSRNHSVYRWVRQGIETALVDWRYQPNNDYIYKGEYRETVGAIDYAGVVGSDGTV